jgi:hypothetical protein
MLTAFSSGNFQSSRICWDVNGCSCRRESRVRTLIFHPVFSSKFVSSMASFSFWALPKLFAWSYTGETVSDDSAGMIPCPKVRRPQTASDEKRFEALPTLLFMIRGVLGLMDLPSPALDCEAFASVSEQSFNLRGTKFDAKTDRLRGGVMTSDTAPSAIIRKSTLR